MIEAQPRLARLEPARVCIIKPSSLGDVVHALPILTALRARWPLAHISWVVNHPFREVLEGHPALDELIVHDRSTERAGPLGISGTGGLFRRLAQGRFDLTIDLQGLLRSGLMTAATRAHVRVGMADAREGARWFYTDRVDASRLRLHAVERVRRVAAAFGASMAEPQFGLTVATEHAEWARHVLEPLPRPRIVLNLGAQWLTKRWPPEHFAEIARRAVTRYGAGLIAVGSASDRGLVEDLVRHAAPIPILNLCGQTGLNQLAAVMTASDLLISNDTGPLHLAAAAGARVVGIYTCTDPVLTGPFGPRATTVQTAVWCKCSLIKTCRRMECMSELTPDRVWPVVQQQTEQAINATARAG